MPNSGNQIINVVHITKSLESNGISTVVMNYTCNMDKSKYKNTIIAGTPIVNAYRNRCADYGVDVIEVPSKKSSSVKYYMATWKILKNKHFDIAHIHGNSATITIEMIIAKLAGIKVRVAHSHNSTCDHIKVHQILSPLFRRLYTKGYACSELAGKWLFGDSPFSVLPNGFEIKKFIFDQATRENIRKELDLEDKFVIGNVARFNDQKNHIFLLNIFEQVARENKDAVLFLVGTGPLLGKIQQMIQEHPYKERIIYYGETDHIESLYNAMDIFVLPSKYEGLGIVFIEAQINGLRCVTSDQVPKEVNINNHTVFLSLEKGVESWASEIHQDFNGNRKQTSELAYASAQNYDIKGNVDKLEKDYLGLVY